MNVKNSFKLVLLAIMLGLTLIGVVVLVAGIVGHEADLVEGNCYDSRGNEIEYLTCKVPGPSNYGESLGVVALVAAVMILIGVMFIVLGSFLEEDKK